MYLKGQDHYNQALNVIKTFINKRKQKGAKQHKNDTRKQGQDIQAV